MDEKKIDEKPENNVECENKKRKPKSSFLD